MQQQFKFKPTMAGRRKSDYFCELCGKDYYFRSKFQRHLSTESHLRFVQSLQIGSDPLSDECSGEDESSVLEEQAGSCDVFVPAEHKHVSFSVRVDVTGICHPFLIDSN